MKKKLIVLALAVIALLMIVPLASNTFSSVQQTAASYPQPSPSPSPAPAPTPQPTPTVSTVRFSATGDNLIHNGIFNQAARRAQAEGETGYDFSIGCRVFSLANNHTYDKGAEGIAATRRFWASLPEDAVTCGLYEGEADYDNIVIRETNGIRIAYLSYTEFTNGIPTPAGAEANLIYTRETDVIQRQIELARQQADFVVVGVHWGVEGSHKATDAQRALAQQMADWGAGVVIGTHPHVVQDAQWLTAADGRQVFVAYSLGNFLNAQSTADTMIGVVLSFTLEKTTQPDGSSETVLKEPMLHPTVNHYGQNYSQIRIYLYKDYTDELAASHGVRANFPGFSKSYIESVLRENIDNTFLDL